MICQFDRHIRTGICTCVVHMLSVRLCDVDDRSRTRRDCVRFTVVEQSCDNESCCLVSLLCRYQISFGVSGHFKIDVRCQFRQCCHALTSSRCLLLIPPDSPVHPAPDAPRPVLFSELSLLLSLPFQVPRFFLPSLYLLSL